MSQPPVSVIVVSRHRPVALRRCLVGLSQLDHTNFELIVVADPAAAAEVAARHSCAKVIAFDQANISAARNLGLEHAAGKVIAFIDDDAVPEPTWLSRLCAPFHQPDVIAAAGFVRGRNGISYQWQACETDSLAQDHPLAITATTLRQNSPSRAVKTQGTNCAFRAQTLREIGGFDPAFRFFLDETDVNLRLANSGLTAIVPDAQVHHGYEASAHRAANRVPLSLYDIAASTAIFLRRHQPLADMDAAFARLSQEQSKRIATHRRAGRLTADAEQNLLISLIKGWRDGLVHPLAPLPPLPAPRASFIPFPALGPQSGQIFAGRFWQRPTLIAAAKAARPAIATVICLSPTAKPHKLKFQPEGYWLLTGGIFGQSDRSGPKIRFATFKARIAEEVQRISPFRPTR
jgi:O-antigen biosynthesis protein